MSGPLSIKCHTTCVWHITGLPRGLMEKLKQNNILLNVNIKIGYGLNLSMPKCWIFDIYSYLIPKLIYLS